MSEWIPLTAGFIAADVIRWEEAVFSKAQRRSRRAMKIGARRITAEVGKGPDSEGWVALLVRQCQVLSEIAVGHDVEVFANGTPLRRSVSTILRGKPERLLWSDESARDVVASRFLGVGQPAQPRTPTQRPPKKPRSGGRRKRTRR